MINTRTILRLGGPSRPLPLPIPLAAGQISRPYARPRARQIHGTPAAQRDLFAKYRRPPPAKPAPAPVVHQAPPVPAHTGPRDKFVEVEGVRIPPKPIVPGDEDCCMSGCVHCVLTIYADDLQEYNAAMDEARGKLEAKGLPRDKWPRVMDEQEADVEEEAAAAPNLDSTLAAFAALEAKLAHKDPQPAKPKPKKPVMDPGMSAFMALEAKLREKHKHDAV